NKGKELVDPYQLCYQKMTVMELCNLRNSGSSLRLTNFSFYRSDLEPKGIHSCAYDEILRIFTGLGGSEICSIKIGSFFQYVLRKYEMPDIDLNFIIRGVGVDGIFTLSVDNGESVEFLKNKIRSNQLGSLKNPTTPDNREGQLMNPQEIISEYFTVLDIHALRTNPPYLSEDGEIGPINVIIYPSAE
ncbi:457_t:CDS:2, partial [Acaulospora morrowiae]